MQTKRKPPNNAKNNVWHTYLEELTKNGAENSWLPGDVLERLKNWQKRFYVYSRIDDKSFKKVKAWKKKNQLNQEGEKLYEALIALKELKTNEPNGKYENMQKAALDIVNIQLMKLEISQLRMLSKAQNLKRNFHDTPLEDLEIKLKSLRNQSRKNIEDRPNRFSAEAMEYDLKHAPTFFKAHESKIHYNEHYRRSDRAADTFNVFSAFNNLLRSIANISAPLLSALSTAGSILHAIPFVNALVAGITIFIHAAKMWLQHKSLTKKAFAGILVGVVIGGFIAMGVATVAAGAIAVGLMTIGVYVKHIHPWANYLYQIYKKKKELVELAQTREKLSNNDESFSLGSRERQFLMVTLEHAWIKGEITQGKFSITKYAILNEGYSTLRQNSYIKNLLNNEDLKLFLLKEMDQRQTDLNTEIKALSALERRKRWNVINGVFAIIGAVLLCIPTPVTMILGASILMTTAIIGVSITFDLGTKIKNLFNRIFNKNNEPTSPSKDLAHKFNDELGHSLRHNLESTAEVSKDLHIDLKHKPEAPVQKKTSGKTEPVSSSPSPQPGPQNDKDEREDEKNTPPPPTHTNT